MSEISREKMLKVFDDMVHAIEKIINASYGELRPLIEKYQLDVKQNTFRTLATEREWEVARATVGYFQSQLSGIKMDNLEAIRSLIENRPKVSEIEKGIIKGSLTISICEIKKTISPIIILDSLMAGWRAKFVQALREAGVEVEEEK